MKSKCLDPKQALAKRLWVIGTPSYAINPFVELVTKWASCSGEEWAVSRLKDLKQIMIHRYSNIDYTPKFFYRKNRKGDLYGVVGSLIRYGLKGKKQFSTVINTFMVYTYYVSVHLTGAQRKKFLDAVTATPPLVEEGLVKSLRKACHKYVPTCGQLSIPHPRPLILYRGSAEKHAPTHHEIKRRQSDAIASEMSLLHDVNVNAHIRRFWNVYRPIFRGTHLFDDPTENIFGEYAYHFGDKYDPKEIPVGEVHFLQEPGYKLRSIASPFRLFQIVTEPLKRRLKDIVSTLEWDCTHDQSKALPYVQEALSSGRQVYSVDLSSATDYFPLELQAVVLREILPSDSVEVFLELSTGRFRSELGVIHWNRGQPLGFNPSFFAFTLTHGLLLASMVARYDHQFFVVGDDVVILDKDLYLSYIKTLASLGCPYSKDKSLVSSVSAEFAGKLILSDRVVPQLKWRKLSDDNFLDLARIYGPRIRHILSSRQNKVLDVFAHVPDFIHGMGLNWSYPGSTLGQMIKDSLYLEVRDSAIDSLTGIGRLINHNLYGGSPFDDELIDHIDLDAIKDQVATFDEKVASAFRKIWSVAVNQQLIPVISDLLRELGISDLPLSSLEKSRSTVLDRLLKYVPRT